MAHAIPVEVSYKAAAALVQEGDAYYEKIKGAADGMTNAQVLTGAALVVAEVISSAPEDVQEAMVAAVLSGVLSIVEGTKRMAADAAEADNLKKEGKLN